MSIPKIDLRQDETILWDAPIDTQIMNKINNNSRLVYAILATSMLLLALYLMILFANGFWGANENVRNSRLIATIVTAPAVLVSLVALWAFIERFRLIGSHTMPAHYFVTNQRAISVKDTDELFDEINLADVSHTSIDGQSETQILMLARTASDKDEEERKPPFLFIHLEDLNAVKTLVDQQIVND